MRDILIAVALLALAPTASFAHGGQGHGNHAVIEGGAPGKAAEAARTVTIVATETEFWPTALVVKAGETIRFIIRNDGKMVHEFTIGTKSMQVEHQLEMLGFAESGAIEADKIDRAVLGSHGHGNNVVLEPGQSGEIVWTFAKASDLEFACNIPGHYESGMKGKISFE